MQPHCWTWQWRRNMMDVISGDIELILSAMKKSRELTRALKNPVIKPETKVVILDEILNQR